VARKTRVGKRSQDRKAKRRAKARRSQRRNLLLRRFASISGIALALAILLAGVLMCLSLLKSTPEQLTGRLAGVQHVAFTEGTQKEGGISPGMRLLRTPRAVLARYYVRQSCSDDPSQGPIQMDRVGNFWRRARSNVPIWRI